jgi:membrane-associated phospholipid phosphatase
MLAGLPGLIGFLVLAGLVLAHPGALPLDRALHRFALDHRAHFVGAAKVATTMGTAPVVVPVLLLAGLVAARRTGRWVMVLIGPLLLLIGQAVRGGASVVIDRPRPPRADWIQFAAGHSFPSGHSTTAALSYALVLLLVVRGIRSGAARAVLACVLIAVAALVGVSRVVLGMHWPTDVLGAWSLALALAALSAGLLRSVERRWSV